MSPAFFERSNVDLGKVRTDAALEEQGAWVKYDETTSFLLASAYSHRYRKAQRKFVKPYANVIRREGADSIPDEDADGITISVLVDSVVLGWKGLYDNGREIEYSKENCRRLLTEFPRIREWVAEKSQAAATYRPTEEDEKNSAPVSAGTTAGTGVATRTA